MARTNHQLVQKVIIAATAYKAGKRKASNRDLKQASSQGRGRIKSSHAPDGYAPVPASVATLPPGLGPPMSSAPGREGRGTKRTGSNSNAKARRRGKATQSTASVSNANSGGARNNQTASRRGRR